MCTIPLVVFVLVIYHASPWMNTAKFNIRFSPFNFPAVCVRIGCVGCLRYRACGLLPTFVDGLWSRKWRTELKYVSSEICRPYMNLEGLKTAFNYYMDLGAGQLDKILS